MTSQRNRVNVGPFAILIPSPMFTGEGVTALRQARNYWINSIIRQQSQRLLFEIIMQMRSILNNKPA